MQKAIVTGGAGFIGSHLVDKLIEQGIEVTVLDNLSTGKKQNINPKAKFIECDIFENNYGDLDSLIKGNDTVFHLAAKVELQESIVNPTKTFENNIIGTPFGGNEVKVENKIETNEKISNEEQKLQNTSKKKVDF